MSNEVINEVKDGIENEVVENVRDGVINEVENEVEDGIENEVLNELVDGVENKVKDGVINEVENEVKDGVEDGAVDDQIINGVLYGVTDGAEDFNAGFNASKGAELITEELYVYKPVQYNYLWYTSWLFLFNSCYTVYLKKYDFAVFPGAIFVTSINYWRNPRFNSWERTFDVTCVHSSVAYNIFRSFGAEYSNTFYMYIVVGLLCYLLSNYNHRQNRLYVSSFFHSLVHLFGNMAVWYLYSGYIADTWDNPITQRVRNSLEDMAE